MKESLVAAEVNLTSHKHTLIGVYYGVNLDSAFLLSRFRMTTAPLKITLKNREIVVESMIQRAFIHDYVPFLRLSDESLLLLDW